MEQPLNDCVGDFRSLSAYNVGAVRISAESVKEVNETTTRVGNDIIKKN
jgi:hypothetical protein